MALCLFSDFYFILHTRVVNRFYFCFLKFPVHSHFGQSNTAAYTHNNAMIEYVECEHLRVFCGVYKRFSDLRRSVGWRSNLKDCSSNRTERKIMRKIMRKEDNEVGERQNHSHFYTYAHTHILAVRPV